MTPDGRPSRSHVSTTPFLFKMSFHPREASRVLGDVRGRTEAELQKYFLIAIGGALGSLTRYLVGSMVAGRMGMRFPYGTFVINMTACLIIGFSVTFIERHTSINPAWDFLIPVGFIGAYSTFSTFEMEAFAALQTGEFLISAAYVAGSVLLGLVAVWFGVLLARLAF
jgi:CrcB protein